MVEIMKCDINRLDFLVPGYSAEDLHSAQVLLQEAIEMRRRYMEMSKQRFSTDCEEFIDQGVTSAKEKKRARGLSVGVSLLDHQVHYRASQSLIVD